LFLLFATGVNDTSSATGKSTAGLLDTGVVDTGGKFAASVFDSSGKFLVHLALRISLRILEKNRNDPFAISRGLREDDS
jgi:hypothetical protein